MKREIIVGIFYVRNIKKVGGGEDFPGGSTVKTTLPVSLLDAGRKNNVGDGAGGRDTAVMCRGVQQKRNFIFDTWVAVRWLILTIDNY